LPETNSTTKSSSDAPSPLTLVLWGLAPWPVVWLALQVFHSAVLAFAFYHSVCLLGTYLLRKSKSEAEAASTIANTPVPWRNLFIGTVIVNILAVVIYKAVGASIFPAEEVVPKLSELGISGANFWPVALYFIFINPVIEENFWRGTILRHWQTHLPANTAIALSGAFFAAWHFLPTRLFVPNTLWLITGLLAIFSLGTGLGYIVRKTGRLTEAIFLHALAADLPIMIILYYLLF
jgi:membrane protease YdiL (CAAX protease family)